MVSVVVPAYNGEELLAFTIESVLAQTYPHWECLIVDDGSTDRTLEIADRYCKADARFRVISRDREPKSANTCRNIGLEKSNGEYIIFLDSDDLLAESCLENRVKAATANPGMDFWVFRMWDMKEGKIVESNIHLRKDEDILANFLQMKLPWITGSPLWKKSFLLDLKGFDESMTRLQDVELHIRALSNLKNGFLVDWDSKPDWFYRFKPYSRVQRNLNLLVHKVNSSIFLYKKLLPVYRNTRYIDFIRKGVIKNFIDFLFENVLNDFQGQELIGRFILEVKTMAVLDPKQQRKIETVSKMPGWAYRVPGAYRLIKKFLAG